MSQADLSTTAESLEPIVVNSIRAAFSREPVVWPVALLVTIFHIATASRYDAQRNELYFLVCGWHRAAPQSGQYDRAPPRPLAVKSRSRRASKSVRPNPGSAILRIMKVEEIAEAIAKLPPDQFARFRRWFHAFEAGRADHAKELDSTATTLGRLAGRAFAKLKKRANEP